MTRKLFIAGRILLAVFIVTWGIASLIIDPENLGGRLALYLTGILALVAGIVVLIIGFVRRRRESQPPQ